MNNKYKKLIITHTDPRQVRYLMANIAEDFDMAYFCKSKGKEPLVEWQEESISQYDKDLVPNPNTIFYVIRSTSGKVLELQQLYGFPVDSAKPARKRTRVRKEEKPTRRRVRGKSDEPRKRVRTRRTA